MCILSQIIFLTSKFMNGIVFHFCTSNFFGSNLIEHSWVFISTPTFSLLQYVALIEVYKEYPASWLSVRKRAFW